MRATASRAPHAVGCDNIEAATAEESGAIRSGPATVDPGVHHISKDPGSQDVCRRWSLSHPRTPAPTQTCRGRGHPQEGYEVRTFPFSAVVGSEDMALALILTTVSPDVGGVLVRGEKGTAKTTMVRALAQVLPSIGVVEGCRFSCDPLDPDPTCPDGHHDHPVGRSRPQRVELPVGATEDRVIGSLDLRQALELAKWLRARAIGGCSSRDSLWTR